MASSFANSVILSLIGVYFVHLNIITHQVKGRILRRSCGDYANFSYVALDKVLEGEKITTLIVPSEEECELACVDELQCKSINIEKSKKARRCELNKRSTADASDGVALTPRSGWVYKSTSYTDKLIGHYCQRLNPCEVEHLCIDVCYEPGYKCTHCKELQSGKPCQRYLHNIALGKITSQSSTYMIFGSDNAIDGHQTDTFSDSRFNCIHTENEKRPWWSVYFQGMAVVYKIAIFARSDGYYDRLGNLDVKLGNVDEPGKNNLIWDCPWFSKEHKSREVLFAIPKKGKYLFVESQIHNPLDLCEVEVIGYLE
ncbi:uncharacterized protein LOC135688147 isoform X3 [Rhopilema esculentum]|uniref:uncharacterized protein LOC135688147 isoform X3 n=1 Tax=Rhopilema esculentum TaxID=499914 RepID=UPI0031D4091C